jgi:uncharacterized protein (DUF779 family)
VSLRVGLSAASPRPRSSGGACPEERRRLSATIPHAEYRKMGIGKLFPKTYIYIITAINMRLLFFVIICAATTIIKAQEKIDVTDQTIKIAGLKEEELTFGFAQGDKVIFNFKELDGKELKEIEILEYPTNSKFSDFKTALIENKTFTINKQSAYIFRFKNGALAGRICKIHIERIPVSEQTKNFNTAVTWATKEDTTWNTYTKDVIVGYDTTYEQKTKRELVKTEQKEELLLDKTERVHSQTNENGNKTSIFFTLPTNQTTGLVRKRVVAWAYWVGVGEEAALAWKSNVKAIAGLAQQAANVFISPLGGYCVGAIGELMTPKMGEDVSYSLTDRQGKDLFFAGSQYNGWDFGKGVAGYKKFLEGGMCQGTYFICMSNDNYLQGVDANVKVVAIVETKTYEDIPYTDVIVTPKMEKKMFTEPVITKRVVPVTGL